MASQVIPRARHAMVTQYLLPGEKPVITFRKHPCVLVPPVLLLAACLIAVALSAADVIPGGAEVLGFLSALFVVSLCFLARAAFRWWRAFFVVSRSRVIFINWRKLRELTFVSAPQVTDLKFSRSVTARLIGYGRMEFKTSGNSQVVWRANHIPFPEQVYLEVAGLLFPEGGVPAPVWPAMRKRFRS
jgi:hypothetical protein